MTTRYLVDDLNPTGYLQVLEEVVGGVVQTRYAYGTGLVSQTRNVSSAPTTSYYGFDAHGSVTFLTDTAGIVTDSYDYDAWGRVIAAIGSTPNARLYASEEFDSDLGFINLRARYYMPIVGRFSSFDPLAEVPPPLRSKDSGAISNLLSRVQLSPHVRAILPPILSSGLRQDLTRLFAPVVLHKYLYANGDPANMLESPRLRRCF